MKVLVDSTLCAGHGQCAALGPDLFTLDDFGYAEQPDSQIPEHLIDQAKRGAEACPERAITLIE
jgi:ferredoxin